MTRAKTRSAICLSHLSNHKMAVDAHQSGRGDRYRRLKRSCPDHGRTQRIFSMRATRPETRPNRSLATAVQSSAAPDRTAEADRNWRPPISATSTRFTARGLPPDGTGCARAARDQRRCPIDRSARVGGISRFELRAARALMPSTTAPAAKFLSV